MPRLRTKHSDRAAVPPREVLLRGLSVLEALNWRPISTIEHIAARTALPKPTVVRVLGILSTHGYVQRLPRRKGYMLSERVLNLSSGFTSRDAVVEVARSLIAAFTARHKWPVSLATFEIDSMRVRVSSGTESPFATADDRARLNRRVPLLVAAHGRAYVAFCPEEERRIILSLLRSSERADDLVARDEAYVDAMIAAIRRTGYAITAPIAGEPAIGLAVPVAAENCLLGTISLRYLGKAASEREVAKKYLGPLHDLADAISRGTARRVS